MVARHISRFVFCDAARIFSRFRKHELRNISRFFTCAIGYFASTVDSLMSCILDSSVGRVYVPHSKDSRFESCSVQKCIKS